MPDEILGHYHRELTYIRRLAAEFAEAHPQVASRLRVSPDAVEDPHVARLIDSFAFLTARIRLKLDDDFPELTDALLNVLYPHYLAPVPSMAIVQFEGQPDLSGPYNVSPGAELDSEAIAGESCRFRTAYPTVLWPIDLVHASLKKRPITAPQNRLASNAIAVLRLTLRCRSPEMSFTKLGVDGLRFFLRGQPQQVLPLHELLHNDVISVALADSPTDPNPVILQSNDIRAVGFDPSDGMLPYPARSFVGYRLLTEYFVFPEKFLFFDLANISAKTLLEAGNQLEIFIYLRRSSVELERSLSTENFALGCTPIVNLFSQRAEPIALSHETSEYRVVPDARRLNAMEVYSVDRLVASWPDGSEAEFEPFYGIRHAGGADRNRRFFYPVRRPAGPNEAGTELFLSLVDVDFNPSSASDGILSVETTCLNRDLPSKLPYGGGHPRFQLVEGAAGVARIACLTPPVATLRAPMGRRAFWRLISHLSLNHLSLTDGQVGAEALREILRLYDYRSSPETQAAIESILAIRSRRGAARAPHHSMGALCRGIDVEIEFDERRFEAGGLFLLSQVLERFLALYANINSFTRLAVRLSGRPGVLKKWPPRSGDHPIL